MSPAAQNCCKDTQKKSTKSYCSRSIDEDTGTVSPPLKCPMFDKLIISSAPERESELLSKILTSGPAGVSKSSDNLNCKSPLSSSSRKPMPEIE